MTEILNTPSKQSRLYKKQRSRLPQTQMANITLHKTALFPIWVFANTKHRLVVVLAYYHILPGASHCLQVVANVLAISATCIEQNSIPKRLDERVDRLKEFRC